MINAPLQDVIAGHTGIMEWARAHVLHADGLKQALVCLGVVALGFAASRWFSARLAGACDSRPALKEWVERRLPAFFTPLFSVIVLWIVMVISTDQGWPKTVTALGIKIVEAWLVIQLFASVLLPPGWTKAVTVVVAGIFALEVLGILKPILEYLDSMALTFDNERVSILELFKATVLLSVMLPLIHKICALLEAGLERVAEVKPRVRVLVSKLTRIGLSLVAFVAALDLVGINLQMLTVFSGAVGLGVGFGLQKVVSNLVSGVILLLDNSIKPGDVIEIGGVYGWVETMNARFASMVTRDGKAFLIPNDDLVANKVVNWSFSGPSVRLKIPVGIAYSSDLKLAMKLMLEAVEGKDRVLADPRPNVLLKQFGDSAIVLELRVWMIHAEQGIGSVVSAIQTSIWEQFTANGIEFPFPQQDVHVKEPVQVRVEYAKPGEGKAE